MRFGNQYPEFINPNKRSRMVQRSGCAINMAYDIMKKFTTPGLKRLFAKTGLLALGLALASLAVGTARAQFSFYAPQTLNGDSGTVENDNSSSIIDPSAPTIAGNPPTAPLWYTWTASHTGDVDIDTVPTNGVFFLDTVLAVYTVAVTNDITQITQIAANDDLFPISKTIPQPNIVTESGSPSADAVFDLIFNGGTLGDTQPSEGTAVQYEIEQPYNGPSHLRFTAQAGTTYYFAVDTKSLSSTGLVDLSWGYLQSGVVRFATEDFDPLAFSLTGLSTPMFQGADTESLLPEDDGNDDVNSTVLTYYTYNAQGLLVTINRTAGSSGRLLVDYTVTNATQIPYVSEDDVPVLETYTNVIEYINPDGSAATNAVGGPFNPLLWGLPALTDKPDEISSNVVSSVYPHLTGTLVFDDYEMSKTLLIPMAPTLAEASGQSLNVIPIIVSQGQPTQHPDSIRSDLFNSYFGIILSNPRLDPFESPEVSPPRLDTAFSTAVVRVLNTSADPFGPDMVQLVYSNVVITVSNSTPVTMVTNVLFFTNMVVAAAPTNNVFNFEKAHYRVPSDVNNTTNSPWTQVTVYVERFGTNSSAETLNYRVNSELEDNASGDVNVNNAFNLQPASDYAVPNPASSPDSIIRDRNYDFNMAEGTIGFTANGGGHFYQPIRFNVLTTNLTKFNRDFRIQLYRTAKLLGNTAEPYIPGMVAETTVTILTDDQTPAAGSVDEIYNADFNQELALPPTELPITNPQQDSNPGASGQVNALVVTTNNETLLAGEFQSYNGYPFIGVALVDTNGQPDFTFDPGSGANGFVYAAGTTPDQSQFYIAGAFSAYNGFSAGGIARIGADGTFDSTFNPGLGIDPNTQINAMAVQPDGKVIIGGNFTHYNGTPRNYIARINTDGSLDTTFDPGITLNGPVSALALPPNFNQTFTLSGAAGPNTQVIDAGASPSGTLTMNLADFTGSASQMQIYYGSPNAGSGALIYDTGVLPVNPTNLNFTVTFGPTNGIVTNVLTVVMNPGGQGGSQWTYSGSIIRTFPYIGVIVGGTFQVNNQPYTDICRLGTNGVLDTSFNPGSGCDNNVLALGWGWNGQVIVGGAFTHVNQVAYNHLVSFNPDGSINNTNFFVGSGPNDVVYNVTLDKVENNIYIGGLFDSYNGTHRLRFARLYSNGAVDTTFLDTGYNQFAGLKKIYSYDAPTVYCSAVDDAGNVLIGGAFNQVGGGQADTNVCNTLDYELGYPYLSFGDPNLYVEAKTRDGVRNRTDFARLIGGATPGPGNIQFLQPAYSVNKSQASVFVSLLRTNGTLGPIGANFAVDPGLAQSGLDYANSSPEPLFWQSWDYLVHPARDHAWGLFGQSGALEDVFGLFLGRSDLAINQLSTVNVNVFNNRNKTGNQNATFQLANPTGDDTFYLGAENIPLGAGLGGNGSGSQTPLTIIDDNKFSGVFGFSSSNYLATNALCLATLTRSNGSYGTVTLKYSTTNGTALAGVDYVGLTNISSVFSTTTSNNFNVTILSSSLIYTGLVEKEFGLKITAVSGPVDGTNQFGISNAVVRIINPNFQGYLSLGATNFSGTESSGSLNFIVNRTSGSKGLVSIQYGTSDGTAKNGLDYIGTTNTLTWNNFDASPRVVSIPLINYGSVNSNKQFFVRLMNPMVGNSNTASLYGLITNSTLTIVDDNSYGTLQFSSPTYSVNEDGGFITVPVLRTGGAAGAVSVNYTTVSSNAVSPLNYSSTNGILTFTTNQLLSSITVPIHDDGVVDPTNFSFLVSLSNPTNAALGTVSNAVVNIVDAQTFNQPPGNPDVGYNASTYFNGSVLSLGQQSSGDLIVGGNFTVVSGAVENYLARLLPNGLLDTTFLNNLAGANAAIQTVAVQTDNQILIGGSFTSFDGQHLNRIARINTDGTVDSTFIPGSGADSSVNAICETFIGGNRYIYVGGAFGNFGFSPSPGLVRLNTGGVVDPSFVTGVGFDGPVKSVVAYATNSPLAGLVLVGGQFAHYNGISVTNLVRLTQSGSLDTNFVNNIGSGPAGPVQTILIQPDGNILVGGSFTNFNGVAVNNLVRLNSGGTLDTNFVANIGSGADGTVEALTLQQDFRIVVSGQFATFNGVTRHHVTRLMFNGVTDPTINFGDGANGDIDTVLVQPSNGFIVLGGGFTQYDDQTYNNLVRIYGGSVTGSGAIEFTTANFSVNENGGDAVVTLRRTGGTSGTNISVQFMTSAGTAMPGTNYSNVATTVVFPPGETLESIAVPVFDDNVITSNLTVNLALTNPTAPAVLGDQPDATLTIINDDNAVSFSSPVYSQVKNTPTGVASIDIVRIGGTNNTVSVNFFTTTNGTAITNLDYFPTNGTITFLPGQTDIPVLIPLVNNGLIEGNKTVDLALSNAVNTVLVAPSNAVLTIVDTTPGPGRLCFANTNYTVTKGNTSVQLSVLRTNGSSGTITVGYFTTPGTALPNFNFTPTSGTLTFIGGQTNQSILVPILNNNLVQGTVNFTVSLTNATGQAIIIPPSNSVVNILDDNVGINFVNATNYVSETNPIATILVQRIGLTNNAISANYFTTNGTAFAGTNFVASQGTISFAPGVTVSAISVPMIWDHQVTGPLTFGLGLSNAQPSNVQLVIPTNTLVIDEDGDAGLSFTNATSSVYKNAGVDFIPVICSNTNAEPVSVNYATADGSALAGVHYAATSGTLTFSNALVTNYIVVPIIDNGIIDSNRSFFVKLSGATFPGQVVAPGTNTVTILEAADGFSFSSSVYTVDRNKAGAASITVLRAGNTNQISTIDFTANNGSAVSNVDYYPTNGTLIFTNGITAETISVGVIGSTTVQPQKTVLLQLFSPTNAILSPPSAATLKIIDTSGSLIIPSGSMLTSESYFPPNGIIDPGETVTLLMALRASGGTNVPDVKATLLVTNGVTNPSGLQDYGPLTVGGPSAFRSFTFTAVGTNTQLIAPTLKLSNGSTNLGIAIFTYTLGTWTNVFSNNTAIVVGGVGPGSPYPSSIIVSNLGGALLKSSMVLSNFYHTSPGDFDALLVDPGQQDTLIMSHAGGQNVIKAVTLDFDDAATAYLPQSGQIVTGTNKPTVYGSIINFP